MDYNNISMKEFVHPDFINNQLNSSIAYKYLDKYVTDDIYNCDFGRSCKEVNSDRVIWSFWGQGIENAPILVKMCIESISNSMPDDFEHIVLDNNKLAKYISLPDHILDKYKRGIITPTHLSDLIRLELLVTYGGCWVDATVFCSDKIPMYMLDRELFMFRGGVVSNTVHKMSSWWISSKHGNRLLVGTLKVLLEYWKHEDELIDYFLLHDTLSKLVKCDPVCRELFIEMPCLSNENPHFLDGELDRIYDSERWAIIKEASKVHKLSNKKKHIRGDTDTFYSRLCQGELV